MENKTTMEIKPESLYQLKNFGEQIRVGDIIPAIYDYYDPISKKVYVHITPLDSGFIRLDNFTCQWEDHSNDDFPSFLKGHFKKKVIGRVIAIHSDGSIELDRRQIVKDTMDIFRNDIGRIVNATVEDIRPYGIFADIGNGVRSLIHVTECSKLRYFNLDNFFTVGQLLEKVKIISINPENMFLKSSIKQAYHKEPVRTMTVERVRVIDHVEGGKFVEINPMTTGIMDIDSSQQSELKQGSYAFAFIRKFNKKGFRSSFVCIDDSTKTS